MKKLIRFIFLPYLNKKLLVEALMLVWFIRIGLWLFSYKRLVKFLGHFSSGKPTVKEADWKIINDVAASVKTSSKYVPFSSCLTQALAAKTLLQLLGQNSQLKIGVDKDEENKFSAHAWIEIDEKIIIGKLPNHKQRFAILKPSEFVVI